MNHVQFVNSNRKFKIDNISYEFGRRLRSPKMIASDKNFAIAHLVEENHEVNITVDYKN